MLNSQLKSPAETEALRNKKEKRKKDKGVIRNLQHCSSSSAATDRKNHTHDLKHVRLRVHASLSDRRHHVHLISEVIFTFLE